MAFLSWKSFSYGMVTSGAVCGGWSAIDEEPLFIGRAYHDNSLHVGKISARHNCCYFTVNGQQLKSEFYQVLVNSGNIVHLEWVHDEQGGIPAGAVEGGHDAVSGEKHYVGRHSHMGDTIPGKIQKSRQCLFVPYDNKEVVKTKYDVLVQIQKD